MNFVHELHQELTYSARRHVGDATVVRSDARAERRDGVVLIEPQRRGPRTARLRRRGAAGQPGTIGAARAREDEDEGTRGRDGG